MISDGQAGPGLFVWFNPRQERLSLRDLTEDEKKSYLDKPSSVSGSVLSLNGPDSPALQQMDLLDPSRGSSSIRGGSDAE